MVRSRFILLPLLTAVGVLSLLGFSFWGLQPEAPVVDAQVILTRASNTVSAPQDAALASHMRFKIYERANPGAVEPPDPYHKPVLQHYSEYSVVEIWQRGGDSRQQRTTQRDERSGLLLADRVQNGEFRGSYSAALGYASVDRAPDASPGGAVSAINPVSGEPKGLRIVGARTSAWGKPAHVIERKAALPTKEEFQQTLNVALPYQKPYMNDLDIVGMQQQWIVDQESGRMVSYKREALTPSGAVVLEQIDYDQPELLQAGSLPTDWLAFPPKGVPVRQAAQGSTTRTLTLTETVATAPFAVFLPDATGTGLSLLNSDFRTPVTPRETWGQNWRFDIEDASQYGLTLMTIYSPGPAGTTTRVVAIAQGPSDLLVPLMREVEPTWTESRPVQVSVAGQRVTAWVATGGSGNIPPARVGVMLEVKGTFLFVVGQEYTERDILQIVEGLQQAE